jgi:hypothetical protein
MAGLDPAIHEAIVQPFFVDDRAKPGHDGLVWERHGF